jgi:Tfp pilus assembly protein PilZ
LNLNLKFSQKIPIIYPVTGLQILTRTAICYGRGLFIDTQRPLLVGDEIIMTFRLDGFDKPIKVRGEIAHATRSGVGVEFKDISPYLEEMLRTVIKRMK